jgi:hypothetical protein
VVDFNRSCQLLSPRDLSPVCRDYLPLTCSSAGLLNESTTVVADDLSNMYVVTRPLEGGGEMTVNYTVYI